MTKRNKVSASVLALSALLLGGVGSVALQAHAQSYQAPTIQQVVPTVVGSTVSGSMTSGSVTADTDNIQDPSGVEKPDSVVEKDVTGTDNEAADAKGDLPGGHEDTAGTVDH